VEQWDGALVFIALSTVVAFALLLVARLLAVRARKFTPLKQKTYECGEEPEGVAWVRFHPRYYVVALVFVLFDVEAVFLFPWALSIRDLGGLAIVDMAIFVSILMLGWLYALKKGALKWQ
jgi:NADH:ubiquinone oxidoreductase subunit 3 (subunit A)